MYSALSHILDIANFKSLDEMSEIDLGNTIDFSMDIYLPFAHIKYFTLL